MVSTTDKHFERVQAILGQIKDIPTLPQVYAQIQKLLENPKTSAKDVAEIVQSDPAIASKVLKIANSPFYGFPQRITTITHAIVVLGFNSIKNAVLSCSIAELFKSTSASGFDYKGFWKHCVVVGAFSSSLAKKAGITNTEEAFLSGLLHDLGKVLINKYLPEESSQIAELIKTGKSIGSAENEILGFTHSEVSAWLYEKWNLSKLFVEVAKYHHNPAVATNFQIICNIVHVADVFARGMVIGSPGDDTLPILQESSLAKLRITPDDFDRILLSAVSELNKSRAFLEAIS